MEHGSRQQQRAPLEQTRRIEQHVHALLGQAGIAIAIFIAQRVVQRQAACVFGEKSACECLQVLRALVRRSCGASASAQSTASRNASPKRPMPAARALGIGVPAARAGAAGGLAPVIIQYSVAPIE